jgi:hypothetical protein
VAIGFERLAAAWPNMVQGENGSDPGEDRLQQAMGAGEIQGSEAGADDVVAKLLHPMAGRLVLLVKLAGNR